MSRIGNMPIIIPSQVTVEIKDGLVKTTGPLGQLTHQLRPEIQAEEVDQKIILKRNSEEALAKALHGLERSLLANMVAGVEKGWQKKLELVGVGFRAQTNGEKLTLNVGFSHPSEVTAPLGIKFAVEENTRITVSGIDKELVGQVAANIRGIKPPEPYQGKGIRYGGEYVRKKAGKAAKAGAAGTGAK